MSDQHVIPAEWGVSDEPVRIAFGPKEWQTMQPEVASMLLTLWRERAPATFGAYLAEVLTGTRPSGRKNQP